MESGKQIRANSRKKWLSAVAVILAIGSAVGILSFFRRARLERAAPTEVILVLHLEPLVVNLADPDQRTYLRIGIDVGLSTSEAAKNVDPSASSAVIRDTLLEVVMSLNSEELSRPEDKRKLKQTILQKVNERAPALKAREIYFTEFLLQK